MCTRFYFGEAPELSAVMEEMNRSPLMAAFRNLGKTVTVGEIRPADVAPAIASSRTGKRKVFPMQWGYTGKTLLINARTETAGERPSFRDGWREHRCVIPASWYFEWEHLTDEKGRKKTGDKFCIHPRGEAVTWLCGLYRMEGGLPHFVVLTREAEKEIRFIHDRMPLMLPEAYVRDWIRPGTGPEELMKAACTEMICERLKRKEPKADADAVSVCEQLQVSMLL